MDVAIRNPRRRPGRRLRQHAPSTRPPQRKYNDYQSCIAEAPSWAANNYVDEKAAPAAIEVSIPLATLGLTPGTRFGIAFDVTDTQRVWTMWPRAAQLAIPASWGAAQLE